MEDLSDNVKLQLQTNVKNYKYFSLALDESTDVSDISQLLVCIRTVDENFIVCEELLKTCPLYGSAKGIDIFNSLVSVVESYGGFEKCECVVTGGARAMFLNLLRFTTPFKSSIKPATPFLLYFLRE